VLSEQLDLGYLVLLMFGRTGFDSLFKLSTFSIKEGGCNLLSLCWVCDLQESVVGLMTRIVYEVSGYTVTQS